MTLKDVIASDLAMFVNPNDLGDQAVFHPDADFPVTINVLFEKPYTAINASTGIMESRGPEAIARECDVTGIIHGATLTIKGVDYTVTGIEPDGEGMAVLELSEVTT